MARKRVHEIAKAQGLTSKQVLAALQAAGIEAKAAASSVEEDDALRALAGDDGIQAGAKPSDGKPARDRAEPASAPSPEAKGGGDSKPAPRPVRREGGASSAATGGGRKRRRVVIDSQASRREHMPQAPPPRPPRRRGGRRRRPVLEEPQEKAPVVEQEPEATKIASGATVREVAETLGIGQAEVIKSLMQLGQMATLTQTLSDEAILTLADALNQKVEIVRAAEEEPEEPA